MGLGAEVEDEGRIGRSRQCLDRAVDGEPIGEVSPVDGYVLAEMADVVQSAARRGAHEDVHARSEADERLRHVRAHETVRTRHEHRSSGVGVADVLLERGEVVGAQRLVARGHDWR